MWGIPGSAALSGSVANTSANTNRHSNNSSKNDSHYDRTDRQGRSYHVTAAGNAEYKNK